MTIKDLKAIKRIPQIDILNYEVHSHWLASYVWFSWGQDVLSRYFAWKVRRKYKRYKASLDARDALLSINQDKHSKTIFNRVNLN